MEKVTLELTTKEFWLVRALVHGVAHAIDAKGDKSGSVVECEFMTSLPDRIDIQSLDRKLMRMR